MTNLKLAKGRVPITNRGSTNTPYLLVNFPSKKVFDDLYPRNSQEQIDRSWEILNRRSKGASLVEAGKPFSLTRERVRQIEARFCRRVGEHYWAEVDYSLNKLGLVSFLKIEQI